MKEQKPHKNLAAQTMAAFSLGLAAAVLGILNYFFPDAVTVLSLIGFFAGAAGLVFSILARKQKPDKPPLGATMGLVLGIVGLLWNLAYFVACSNLACGAANIF